MAAMKYGAHVLSEKTVSDSLESARTGKTIYLAK